MRKLYSELDRSVNFVIPAEVGYFEARFVSRPNKNYFIVYLSSQSGCAKACRMCHLTATRQVRSVDASLQDFEAQADMVLQHWDSLGDGLRLEHKRVHFNFMARGEALECRTVLERGDELLGVLQDKAAKRGLVSKFLISTIFPKTRKDLILTDTFRAIHPELYYSIYAVNDGFRRKWLPQAMAPNEALKKLADWQRATGKRPKVHFAFIKGENDSEQNVRDICLLLAEHELDVDVNIVRYNPPDERSQEADEPVVARNALLFKSLLPNATVAVIPRVGFDVKASCGTFINGGMFA